MLILDYPSESHSAQQPDEQFILILWEFRAQTKVFVVQELWHLWGLWCLRCTIHTEDFTRFTDDVSWGKEVPAYLCSNILEL